MPPSRSLRSSGGLLYARPCMPSAALDHFQVIRRAVSQDPVKEAWLPVFSFPENNKFSDSLHRLPDKKIRPDNAGLLYTNLYTNLYTKYTNYLYQIRIYVLCSHRRKITRKRVRIPHKIRVFRHRKRPLSTCDNGL